MEQIEILDGCFTQPFRCVISGSSGVGKSKLVEKILINKNGLYRNNFDSIIYCYGVETKSMNILKEYFKEKIQFFSGIPDKLIEICSNGEHKVLVLEDLDETSFESPLIAAIFKKFSHHFNLNVKITAQILILNLYSV